MKDGIAIPFSAPGADSSARAVKALGDALSKLREDVNSIADGFEKDTQATQKNTEETEKAAKSKRSLGDAIDAASDKINTQFEALKSASTAYAGVTVAALGFAAVTLKLAADHEKEIRTVNQLGGAYAQVQAATHGVIGAQEALKAQQSLVQSGLRVSDAELAAITRKARDFALATGTDATQALDQLIEGLRQGEAGSLRKYGIAVDANKSRTKQFHDSLSALQKEQSKTAVAQTTLNEELAKTPGLMHSMVSAMASAVAQALGFDKALRGMNQRFQELIDLQRQAAKDQQKLATQDQRIALNQQLGRLRAAGLSDSTLATVDTTHMSVEQMGRYQSLLGGINPGEVTGSWQALTDPTQSAALSRRLNEVVARRMRDAGITNSSIAEEMNANDRRDIDARNGISAVGPAREIDKAGGGGGDKDKSPDRATIVEQLRAITRLRAIRGLQVGLQSFEQGANETATSYVERIGQALESRFVVLDEQLIKRRGETEFDFAKRRLDLVASTLKAIGDAENKAQEERARAGEAAFNAMFEATKKDVASIEAVINRLKAPKESAADLLLNDLKSGARTEQGEMLRLGSLQNDVIAANANGDAERVTAIRAQADAIGEATLRYRELTAAQREANDVGLQLSRGMQQSAVMQTTAAQSFSKLTIGAVEGASNAWAQHFVAFAQGKESFDQALKAMTASALEQIAIESAKYAAFQFFQGVGNLAIGNYPGAALNFLAFGGFTALAAGSAIASGELAKASSASTPSTPAANAGSRGQLPQMGRTSGTPDVGGGSGNTTIVFGGPVFQTREAVLESLHGLSTEAFATRGFPSALTAQLAASMGAT